MGYLRPTAIIVSASYNFYDLATKTEHGHWIDVAWAEASTIFGSKCSAGGYTYERLVSPVIRGVVNDVRSFMVAWDGSKEGWDDSSNVDELHAKFVEWLRAQAYDDGSSPLDWVEVQYGGDDDEVVSLSHSGETWHKKQLGHA